MVKCKFGKNLKKFIATRSVKMFELQLVYETETLSTGFYSILTVKIWDYTNNCNATRAKSISQIFNPTSTITDLITCLIDKNIYKVLINTDYKGWIK